MMFPAEDTITGLIEFDPYEARLALRSVAGSDETVHATLLSLAQDLLLGTDDDSDFGASDSAVAANIECLAHDLLLIYRRIEWRRNVSG